MPVSVRITMSAFMYSVNVDGYGVWAHSDKFVKTLENLDQIESASRIATPMNQEGFLL